MASERLKWEEVRVETYWSALLPNSGRAIIWREQRSKKRYGFRAFGPREDFYFQGHEKELEKAKRKVRELLRKTGRI